MSVPKLNLLLGALTVDTVNPMQTLNPTPETPVTQPPSAQVEGPPTTSEGASSLSSWTAQACPGGH